MGGSKPMSLLFLTLAVVVAAMAAKSSAFDGRSWGRINNVGRINEYDENEMLMPTEESRRQLWGGGFISYGALRANSVPCSRRGYSYYNCHHGGGPANPYRRGCSSITNCERFTN